MPLTPEDVQNKQFTVTRFKPGYAEEEVDAFLDEVEAELRRLLAENAELRSRGGAPGPAPAPAAPPPPPAPVPVTPAGPQPAAVRPEEGQEAALRTLVLAQQTADAAVAEARREAERLLTEARGRAASLEQEAQQAHASRLANLESERAQLESAVDTLRRFEQEHRSRLRTYLESQLRELQSRPAVVPPGPGPLPAGGPGAQPLPPGGEGPRPVTAGPRPVRDSGYDTAPAGPPREAGPADDEE